MSKSDRKKRPKSAHEMDIDLDSSVEDGNEEEIQKMSTDDLCRKFLPMLPRMNSKLKKLTTAIRTQTDEIENLKERLEATEKELEDTKKETEVIYRKVNTNNLFIAGVTETKDETADTLLTSLKTLFLDKLKITPAITAAYRIKSSKVNQPKVVKFTIRDTEQREAIWKNKKELGHPYYINEDLHIRERKRRGLLIKYGKELIKSGKSVSYQFNKNALVANETRYVLNGDKLVEQNEKSGIGSA